MGDPLARLTTVLEGRYAIERELGAGGMATVYLAHDVRHDRKVALKVLRPELSAILGGERFLAEIKTTANLQHPHILSLFDSGEADGLVFYVMPYVEGESLRDRLNREKQLPVEDAVRIAREVADALDYAHRQGVVHRDIKPENILLHGGHAMVADFGIALAAAKSEGGTRMTETGMSLGTPHYMAPEQAMGEREITPKADIYALGCVLYEMLTAEPPFVGATAQAIIARVMTEEPRSLTLQRKTIPPHIEAAVRTALEKLPADRFATAAQFGEALGSTNYAVPSTRAMPSGKAAGGRGLRAWAPWAVAAALGGALTWTQLRSRPVEAPVRLSISLPDSIGLRIEQSNHTIALSPDGSVLVYTGQTARRRRMLFARHLELLDPRPLAGTEDADGPTFSPDGAWVAFFAGGKLKRVALAGGPPLTIADATSPRGAAWGPDGTIVFAASANGPLMRVAAAGGRVDSLTQVRLDSGETSHRLPQFLPDGRSVVFTILANGRFRAAVMTIGKPGFRILLDEASNVRYAPTGHLLYATEAGALVAVRFDARRLAVTGSPVSLLEGLLVKGAVGTADFAFSNNGRMAYVAGRLEAARLLLVDAAGVERQVGEGVGLSSPRFSPDGRRIAFASIESRSTDVRVLDIARGTLTRLTFGGINQYEEWTHDSRRIAFNATTPGRSTGNDLFWTLSDGSGQPEPLYVAQGTQQEIQFAPGDRRFAFRQQGVSATGRDIWIAEVDSPQAARPWLATAFEERAMALSPDGHWMAYVSNASGHDEVYVREFPVPSGQWQISAEGGVEPRWAHSGRAIFFRSGDSLISVAVTTRPRFVVGARSLVLARPYFLGDTHHAHWDVAPDDRHFAFISAPTTSPGLIVTLNWFDELRRRTQAGAGAGVEAARGP